MFKLNNEKTEGEQIFNHIIDNYHTRFINETDFPEKGSQGFKDFVNTYIEYRYEPLDEDYEEAKYMTYEFENNLFN